MSASNQDMQNAGGSFAGKRRWLALGILALAAGAVFTLFGGDATPQGRYLTEEAALGNLVVSISASGTLAPTRSVDVGSELSGTLDAVLVDDNDRVTKGQVLARLDPARLQDAVTKSRAAVAAAEAGVALAQATVAESRANLGRLRRVAELSGGKVPAQSELESAEAALDRAVASEKNARAAVAQAQATLKTDETNIGKAVIRSPINGVVLARKVEPGQTVAATMTTPVLFSIAEDLTQMELEVRVDEADVGTVQLGQPASFTVAAWAGRSFPATIRRIGIGSTIIDNVVTYKTVLSLANDDLALRPGMTATARIITANRENALLAPAAALRYVPANGAGAAATSGGSYVAKLLPRPPQQRKKVTQAAPRSGDAQLWVLVDGKPKALPVKVGVSNGRQTEIVGGELKPGMAVITDYQEAKP